MLRALFSERSKCDSAADEMSAGEPNRKCLTTSGVRHVVIGAVPCQLTSNARGLGGAPPLQVEAGQADSAMARSISARRTIESPAFDWGGANPSLPSGPITTFMKKLKAVVSGSGSIPSERIAPQRLSWQFGW